MSIPRKTTLEHRPTQAMRIYSLLRDHVNQWVPLPAILALGIAQYSARIFELRHHWGLVIENRTEEIDGVTHSWFRLIEPAKPVAQNSTATLFGDIRPVRRHRDDG